MVGGIEEGSERAGQKMGGQDAELGSLLDTYPHRRFPPNSDVAHIKGLLE